MNGVTADSASAAAVGGHAALALGKGRAGRGRTHPRAGLAARAHASTARDVAIVGGESETDLGCANSTTPAARFSARKLSEKKSY